MKTTKILYWTTTSIIVLFDGLVPALTSNTELAKQGISHLGYPDYFRTMLTVFKVLGAIVLILPVVKARFKEWAYVGFGITFICAAISTFIIDGFTATVILPLAIFVLLVVSYISYHRLKDQPQTKRYGTSFAFQQ